MPIKVTTKDFIVKAIKVHGDKYDYSKVVYRGAKVKIIIICPIHGDFEQLPTNHLAGSGCSPCSIKPKKQVIKDFIKVHSSKYDYSKMNYKGAKYKIEIICPKHGKFYQAPTNHLQGQGCPECGEINSISNLSKTLNEVLLEFKETHGNAYNYDKVDYKGSHTNITIVCPIHGDFEQLPANHLVGCGCPKCSDYGFNINKPAILYYLKITTESHKVLYKIGITNRTVHQRFNLEELSKIEIVKLEKFEIGADALAKEQEILKKYSEYVYKGVPILVSGNTELFTCNVFEL